MDELSGFTSEESAEEGIQAPGSLPSGLVDDAAVLIGVALAVALCALVFRSWRGRRRTRLHAGLQALATLRAQEEERLAVRAAMPGTPALAAAQDVDPASLSFLFDRRGLGAALKVIEAQRRYRRMRELVRDCRDSGGAADAALALRLCLEEDAGLYEDARDTLRAELARRFGGRALED